MKNTEEKVKDAFESIINEFSSVRKMYGTDWRYQERLNDMEYGKNDETYDEYLQNHKKTEKLPSLTNLPEEMIIIHNGLNYIKMSPEKADEHRDTYVIEKSKYFQVNIEKHLVNPDDYLNRNDGFLKQTLHYWIKKAQVLAEFDNLKYGQKLKAQRLTTYYLLGQPGVGKTALLNYLFSTGAVDLLGKDVIWLRVDLNDPADSGLALEKRLFMKFIKIFCRFYLYERKQLLSKIDFFTELREYLINISKKNNYFSDANDSIINYHIDEYLRLVKEFVPFAKLDKKITLNKLLEEYDVDLKLFVLLSGSLMTFLQNEYKYGYIIIFDGLDSVTLDRIQYETYCEWLNEFGSICDNTKKYYFKSVYIVSMRDYSFVQFYLNVLKENNRLKEEYSILKVRQKNFYSILSSRFNLIIKLLIDSGYSIKKTDLWNIKNNLIDIVNSCLYGLSFADFSKQYIEYEKVKREEYDLITNLCSGNLRAVMRLFRHVIVMLGSIWGDKCFEYLSNSTGHKGCLKHLDGKEWAIYRVLIFGDTGTNAYRCKISYDFGGNANIKHKNTALLPNIFNYKEIGENGIPATFPRNLLKLRVIQLLQDSGGKGRMVPIVEELKKIYPDDSKTLRADVREMIYDGLLIPHRVEQTAFITFEKNNSDYPVKLTPLSYHIKNNIIKESIYYEIVCDDMPIDSKYSGKMQPINKYDSNINLGEYLIIKTFSIFFTLLYLQKIEITEQKQLENKKKPYWEEEIFSKTTIDSILSSVTNYVYKYLKTTRFEDEKKLFIKNWDDYFGGSFE